MMTITPSPPPIGLRHALVGGTMWLAALLTLSRLAGLLPKATASAVEPLALILLNAACVLCALTVARWWRGGPQPGDLPMGWPSWRKLALALGLWISWFPAQIALQSLLSPNIETATQEASLSLGIGQSLVHDLLMILAICVAAPIGEEIIFRGLIFRGLRNRLASHIPTLAAVLLAAIVSSVLFALAHRGQGQGGQFVGLMAMGLLCAGLAQIGGTLTLPIMVHSLNNVMATAVAFGVNTKGPSLTAWHWSSMALAPLLTAAALIAMRRAFPVQSRPG